MAQSDETLPNPPIGDSQKSGSVSDLHRQRLPETIGHYRIKRAIATGGMGTVYEATQENPRRSGRQGDEK